MIPTVEHFSPSFAFVQKIFVDFFGIFKPSRKVKKISLISVEHPNSCSIAWTKTNSIFDILISLIAKEFIEPLGSARRTISYNATEFMDASVQNIIGIEFYRLVGDPFSRSDGGWGAESSIGTVKNAVKRPVAQNWELGDINSISPTSPPHLCQWASIRSFILCSLSLSGSGRPFYGWITVRKKE